MATTSISTRSCTRKLFTVASTDASSSQAGVTTVTVGIVPPGTSTSESFASAEIVLRSAAKSPPKTRA